MINTGDISQLAVLLSILNVPTGGGGGGSVTQSEVQRSAFNYAPATGVDDAFIVTLNPAPGSLTNGLLITMTSGSLENTTNSPTLKVNTIAAKPIILWAGGLAPGDIQANGAYIFVFSSQEDSFYLINPSVSTANSFLTQSNAYNSFVDSGAADAYVGTLSIQSDASLSSGFTVLMQASAANTGASTLTINGDTLPIVFEGGTSLTAGVIVANQIYSLIYSLTFDSWVLLNPKNTSTVLTLADNSNTLPDSFSLGILSNGLLKIDVSSSIATVSNAINSTDFWAPGDVITLPGLPLNSNDAASKGYVDTRILGSVIQVVQTVDTTIRQTTSTVLVDSGISVSITPATTSSRILLEFDASGSNSLQALVGVAFYRNTTSLLPVGMTGHVGIQPAETGGTNQHSMSASWIDSPATTSAVTYRMYFFVSSGTATLGERGSGAGGVRTPNVLTATELRS